MKIIMVQLSKQKSNIFFNEPIWLISYMVMNPLCHTGFSISDSLNSVQKSVLIYETIINKSDGKSPTLLHNFFFI